MKTRALCGLLIFIFFQCCTPTTYVTGSWKSPLPPSKQYSNILVAAFTKNTIAKATLEADMAKALATGGVTVLKSIDEFPPDIKNSDSSKITIMDKVKNRNVDAILTVSIISKETESRYVPSPSPYSPLSYGYYNNFWGYYSHWYPRFYDPVYYSTEKIYYLETNLYDVITEKLMWSAQSKTYIPDDLPAFSKEFSKIIADKMRTDGVLLGTALGIK
ncbi:MAG TPA: hypothetical protein VGC65_10245 [Bacteroidia bacterium]|jgi:hypothetical protein